MSKPPKVVIPGLNRGAGMPAGFAVGRRRATGKGPAELLDITQMRGQGLELVAASRQQASTGSSTALSSTTSLSTSNSTSLSQISSSLSGAISSTTSLSSAVSTVDSNQSTSLSQISSSLSGAISSTTSLSSAVSTVDGNQSTSISQISSALSGFIPAYPINTTGTTVTETFSNRLCQAKTDQIVIKNDQGSMSLSCDTGSGNIVLNNGANTGGAFIGYFSPNNRMFMDQWGIQTGFEFTATPYVNTNKIYHEGNLSFGSGLAYNAATGVLTASGAISLTVSLSTAVSTVDSNQSTSLSQISSSLSGAISSTTSLSSAVSTVDSNQSTSLSQVSSSLSGAISSTSSLSTAISTVDSNQSTSLSANLSAITSLSTAVSTVDSNQSTSLSQISSSLSGAISSTTSLSTAVSTVDSNQSTSISSNLSKITSLSSAVSTVAAAWTAYTPTATPGSGVLTAYTTSGGYRVLGDVVFFHAKIAITDKGTAASFLDISLPFICAAADTDFNFSGRTNDANKTLCSFVRGDSLQLSRTNLYDGTTPMTLTAVNLLISGSYRTDNAAAFTNLQQR